MTFGEEATSATTTKANDGMEHAMTTYDVVTTTTLSTRDGEVEVDMARRRGSSCNGRVADVDVTAQWADGSTGVIRRGSASSNYEKICQIQCKYSHKLKDNQSSLYTIITTENSNQGISDFTHFRKFQLLNDYSVNTISTYCKSPRTSLNSKCTGA